jgi:hypothetical protein
MVNDSLRFTWRHTELLLCLLFSIALVSCYSAAKIYDEFSAKSSKIETVVLVHEAQIFNDIQGKRHFIHIQDNVRSLEWIHSSVKQIVERKGYSVSDQSMWSIGLSEKPNTPLLVFTESEEEWPDFFADEKLFLKPTPIAVKSFGFEDHSISTLGGLHRHLQMESESITDMKGTYYGSYIRQLSLPENSVMLLTQSVGTRIYTGKKVTIFMIGTLAALAGVPLENVSWEQDITSHSLFILHSATGELLWADYLEEVGGNRSTGALENGLERLFSELPDRVSQ